MACRRSDIVDAGSPGVYHCISRCVRRESLLDDPARRAWIVNRLRFLADWMAVDVISFAVMRNHLHLLLAIRPDIVSRWSDREVAERRVAVLPNLRTRARRGIAPDAAPTTSEVDSILASPALLERARSDLSSLGFFHRLLKEPCARRWNRQDAVTGHFWEGRFKSPRVLDLAALVQVARYIELNEVRAGVADAVPLSAWTSASHQWRRMVRVARDAVRSEGASLTPERLARRVLHEEWRPVLPCRAVRNACSDSACRRTGRGGATRRGGDDWAGTALGLQDPPVRLAEHLRALHVCGQSPRPGRTGRIPLWMEPPIPAAIAAAFGSVTLVASDVRRTRGTVPAAQCALRSAELVRQALRAERSWLDLARSSAELEGHVTSRGTCYGTAESVEREARRRGCSRLWVGFERPEADAA